MDIGDVFGFCFCIADSDVTGVLCTCFSGRDQEIKLLGHRIAFLFLFLFFCSTHICIVEIHVLLL